MITLEKVVWSIDPDARRRQKNQRKRLRGTPRAIKGVTRPLPRSYWRIVEDGKIINTFLTKKRAKEWLKTR